MIVLILANEWGEGWYANPKYLAEIGREQLLKRTMRQLSDITTIPVSHIRSVLELSSQSFDSWMTCSSSEALLMTAEIWQDETVILPGDVVWPDNVIELVESGNGDLMFFGNYCDVFAIRFTREHHGQIKNALEQVIRGIEKGKNPGSLWHFYRAMVGQKNLNQHKWSYDIFTVLPSAGTPEPAFTQRLRSFGDYRRFVSEQPEFLTPKIEEMIDNYDRVKQIANYSYGTALVRTPG